jgi:hypothetical protein
MAGPDYPQDDHPVAASKVPSLIHDYRAQREAWREQARNLARMREEVLSAADHEAKDIVSAARADIRRILLKARRDLLVLAAQVRAAGRLGDAEDSTPDAVQFLPSDDLGQASNVLTSARHDVRRVLDESRPELEGLAAEGEALRAALRQQRPMAPAPVEVRRQVPRPNIEDAIEAEPARPVDFEFASLAADDSPDLILNRSSMRRPFRGMLAAAASLAAVAVMGTALWLYRPQANAASKSPAGSAKSTAGANASVDSRAASANTASSLPGGRAPLSIQVALRRASWMRVTTDGRVTAERIFKPGETQNLSATREISIRAGDAGAVTVAVDGRPPVALGREGEAITRQFAVDGARPKAAAPAPETSAPARPSPSVPIARSQKPQVDPTVPSNTVPSNTAPSNVVKPGAAATTAAPPPRVTDQQTVAPAPAASTPVPLPAAPRPSATTGRPAVSTDRLAASPSTPAATQTSLQESLTNVASRHLDAYYRQDRAMMSALAPGANVSDDRGVKEKLPGGLNGVRRSFDGVSFKVFGSEALLTAQMTERMDNAAAGQMTQVVSFIAYTWTQRNGGWQLYDIRIISASALRRALK